MEMLKIKVPLIIMNHKKIALGVLAGVVIVTGGMTTATLLKSFHTTKPDSPDVKAERDYNALVKKRETEVAVVKSQVSLPTNEQPIFATVSNAKSLPSNDFFKNALNDDRILMYPKNKKVFLYRPSTKQVIAQAPLDYQMDQIASQSAAPSPAGTTDSTVQITSIPSEIPVVTPSASHGKMLIQPK
jgi:hypothetical protein